MTKCLKIKAHTKTARDFAVKNIETHALTFLPLNNSAIGTVSSYRFCFVFRNVFSISVDSRFHRTILLAKKRSILSATYVFVYT